MYGITTPHTEQFIMYSFTQPTEIYDGGRPVGIRRLRPLVPLADGVFAHISYLLIRRLVAMEHLLNQDRCQVENVIVRNLRYATQILYHLQNAYSHLPSPIIG